MPARRKVRNDTLRHAGSDLMDTPTSASSASAPVGPAQQIASEAASVRHRYGH
jgi:hypothetical protein